MDDEQLCADCDSPHHRRCTAAAVRSALSEVARRDLVLLDLLAAVIRRLPEQQAAASRDYGRGYAEAIRDVLTHIEKDD